MNFTSFDPVIQSVSLYPSNTIGFCYNAKHSFEYVLNTQKLFLLCHPISLIGIIRELAQFNCNSTYYI